MFLETTYKNNLVGRQVCVTLTDLKLKRTVATRKN